MSADQANPYSTLSGNKVEIQYDTVLINGEKVSGPLSRTPDHTFFSTVFIVNNNHTLGLPLAQNFF